MKLKIDKENDALYLRLDEARISGSEEIEPNIILDFDEGGRVVGIEVLQLSSHVASDKLGVFQFEMA